MDTTARRGISHPSLDRSDRPDAPLHLSYLATALDVDVVYNQGTDAARAAAAHVASGGRFWWATDTGVMWYDDGAAWHTVGSVAAGSITTSQLAASVPIIPLGGTIEWPWASGSIPAWSVLPYGQLLTAAAYPDMQTLADASGRPYGGVAATNFNTPDFRGRTSAGKDDMGGVAAGRITVAVSGINGATLGAVGGAEGVALVTAQLPAHNHAHTLTLPAHTHALGGSTGNDTPDHTHGYSHHSGSTGVAGPSGIQVANDNLVGDTSLGASVRHTHSLPANTGGANTAPAIDGAISNTGSGTQHANVQPTIVVNKIMRVL